MATTILPRAGLSRGLSLASGAGASVTLPAALAQGLATTSQAKMRVRVGPSPALSLGLALPPLLTAVAPDWPWVCETGLETDPEWRCVGQPLVLRPAPGLAQAQALALGTGIVRQVVGAGSPALAQGLLTPRGLGFGLAPLPAFGEGLLAPAGVDVISGLPDFPPDCVFYVKLDEAAGATRVDSIAGNNLTDHDGTVGQAAGIQGNAAVFEHGNPGRYLTRADTAALSVGDIDFTWAGWGYLTDKTDGLQSFIWKGTFFTLQTTWPYWIYYTISDDRFHFSVGADNEVQDWFGSVPANTYGSPPQDEWIFLCCQHDSVNNLVKISVNDGAFDTVAYTHGAYDDSNPIYFGIDEAAPFDHSLSGRLDEWGLWKRLLTAQEVTDLYNGGSGNTYH